jgi:hypothetical protein
MRTLFQRLFSPSEEPSRDPYLFMHAAVEAERRRAVYVAEREALFRRVAERAAKSKLPKGVLTVASWTKHEEEKVG